MNDAYQAMALAGAAFGGGLTREMWQQLFGGRKRQLDEAEVLSKLSKEIRDEIRTDNQDLRDRMDLLVGAVCGLADTVDEYFPKFTGLSNQERIVLRERMSQTRRAALPAV